MAVSDAHKRASVKYNASKDNIMLLRTLARAFSGIVWIFCWMCARLVQKARKQPGRKPHKLPQRSPQLTHERMGVE